MKSIVTRDFIECFGQLPQAVRDQARRAYRHWRENPHHPSLRFKPIQGHGNLYSVRIGHDWRALARIRDGSAIWFWIGSHADYDDMIE